MSKLFLSLHKMTPVSSDGKTSVFKHEEGHEVHVKHKSLTPKMKAELEHLVKTKMAKGGPVQSNPKLEESKKSPKMYAEGTDEISQSDPTLDALNPNSLQQNSSYLPPKDTQPQDPTQEALDAPVRPEYQQALEKEQSGLSRNLEKFGLGTPEERALKDVQQMDNPPTTGSPEVNNFPTAQQVAAPKGQAPMEEQAKPPAAMAGPAQSPQPQQPQQPGLGGIGQGMAAGFAEQRAGIEKEALAKAQMAKATAEALQTGQINKDLADQHYKDQQMSLETERHAISEDIKNQHIDPDKYISDMSTPGKIATGIGLLLGGLGGGLLGKSNPAMDFLNAQIDRNIRAQTTELGKKENLLSANMKQFGNLQTARDFTRVTMNDALKNSIDQAAAKAGTPLAQAEALKAKGQLDQQSGMLMSKISAMQTINSPQAGMGDVNSALQTLRWTDPAQAKEIEERLVPGVGIGSVPVPPPVRGEILAHKQLDAAGKDLLNFVKSSTGSFDPKKLAAGNQKVLALQSLYREGTLGTVYREGEQPLLDQVVKNPTSFFNNYSNVPKLEELLRANDSKFGELKKQYGLRPLAGQQQQSNAPAPRFQKR